MAHTTEIVVNGIVTQVTEFDHPAQAIDDTVDAAAGLLPGGTGLPVDRGGTGAKTPQQALANLGAGVRENLFDNWDFSVNQRGQDSYMVQALPGGNASYTVDRIIVGASANASAELTVSTGYVTLECTPPDGGGLQVNLTQPIDVSKWPRGTYTLSWLYESDVLVRPFAYSNESGVKPGYTDFPATSGKPGIASITFDLAEGDKKVNVNLQINSGVNTHTKIYAPKLERGSGQTLAYQKSDGTWELLPQPDSKPGQMLAECQRYLYSPYYGAISTAPIGTVFASNQTTGFVAINTPALMRTKPVFSGDPAKLWIVKSNGGGAQRPSALSVMGMSGCGVLLSVTASFESDGEYIMYSEDVSNPADFLLSAEM